MGSGERWRESLGRNCGRKELQRREMRLREKREDSRRMKRKRENEMGGKRITQEREIGEEFRARGCYFKERREAKEKNQLEKKENGRTERRESCGREKNMK